MGRGRAALAVATLAVLLPGSSLASHVRPRGATPLRLSMVPAYKQCTSPNRAHGAPLSYPSCSPPVPTENGYQTIGTPDVNGAGANSVAAVSVHVTVGDVRFDADVTDVRCGPATAVTVCANPNAADGPDYSGNMQLTATARITDHDNGPSHTEAATMWDIPFPMDVDCTNTASTSVGSECVTHTTANALVPGAVQAGERIVWAMEKMQLFDGGPDGDIHRGEGSVSLLLTQGVFVP
jgi:hypothetical protein